MSTSNLTPLLVSPYPQQQHLSRAWFMDSHCLFCNHRTRTRWFWITTDRHSNFVAIKGNIVLVYALNDAGQPQNYRMQEVCDSRDHSRELQHTNHRSSVTHWSTNYLWRWVVAAPICVVVKGMQFHILWIILTFHSLIRIWLSSTPTPSPILLLPSPT